MVPFAFMFEQIKSIFNVMQHISPLRLIPEVKFNATSTNSKHDKMFLPLFGFNMQHDNLPYHHIACALHMPYCWSHGPGSVPAVRRRAPYRERCCRALCPPCSRAGDGSSDFALYELVKSFDVHGMWIVPAAWVPRRRWLL